MVTNEWFYLSLISPALWAIVVLVDDNMTKRIYENPFVGTIISGFFALLPLATLFFVPITIPSMSVLTVALLAGFLMMVASWFYFKSLTIELPSVVSVLWSIAPAFIPFLAYFFLQERLTYYQLLGFITILVGSIAISALDIKKFKVSQAFYLMLFAALLTAVNATMQKYVYAMVDFWSGFIFLSIGMGAGSLFFSIAFAQGRKFIREFNRKYMKYVWLFVVTELLNIAAVLASNLAISRGPVSLVKVIEGLQPMYILLFGIVLYPLFPKYFREGGYGKKTRKLFFMALMIVGLYLIQKG